MQETRVQSPGQGRHPGEGFLLGNPMDKGAWQATVHGVARELDMTEQLNNTTTTTI